MRRKHSKIDALPSPVKDTVEDMMKANVTYAEIADYIKTQGYDISVTSVWRHASNLDASLKDLRMAQENFRLISDEINKYPNVDPSEGIIRLLSYHVLEAINGTPEEVWKHIKPVDLLRQATSLARAASYKTKTDIQNKDIMNVGLDRVKELVFEAMEKERPDLYKDVSKFLAEKGEKQ